jgi:hypothetical protein
MACKYFHVVTTVTPDTTANTLVLNFSSPATANDEDRFCFKIVTDIPSIYDTYAVLLAVNGTTTVALWDKYGNPVTASSLGKCKVYKGYYGATAPHVITPCVPITYNCGCGNVL